jgi:perosamine synthetase
MKTRAYKKHNPISRQEINAVTKVMRSGVLSSFVAEWGKEFYGGPLVKKFEKECQKYFKVKHAIAVNSWTSGLICAVGALDIEPGDEIILSPWTMSACAASILHWNAIPIFADINKETFCIDSKSIEKVITNKTRAIMAIDIFGQSCPMDEILLLAKKYNLKVISDTAQSIGAKYKNNKFAGTLADIGGFSLNYHKHIHTGEGGVIVTNNYALSERMKMIRNHAEAVLRKRKNFSLNNMIGYNFRMCEIEAAIGIQQLKKLNKIVNNNQLVVKKFINSLKDFHGLTLLKTPEYSTNVYYVLPILYSEKLTGFSFDKVIKELNKAGVPIAAGYQNLHLLPLFQKKIAYGKKGFPWSYSKSRKNINYNKGICPVAESLNKKSFMCLPVTSYDFSDADVKFITKQFQNIWNRYIYKA